MTPRRKTPTSGIELYLAVRAGDENARVMLETDDDGHPSGHPLAEWDIQVGRPPSGHGQLVRLEPDQGVDLDARRTYWVCLAAVSSGSNIAWVSAAINLKPRRARIAERTGGASWRPAESKSGPGHALRILASSAAARPAQTEKGSSGQPSNIA